jgi:ADP-heptose:LPS heptosyltransferase
MYIVRKRALGDVLWIEPVIRKLAVRYPKLIVYTKYPEVFENYPAPNIRFVKDPSLFIKTLIRAEELLGISWFTINLDNSYERVPEKHFLHAYQLKSGLPLTEEYPKLFLSQAERDRTFLQTPYVVLHLESFAPVKSRRIHGVDWSKVVDYIRSKGLEVVQVGTAVEEIPGTKTFKTGIRDLITLISKSSYFIGIDSGPSHIAASLRIPSLVLFTSVDPLVRHFPVIFNGKIIKNACEYDGQYHKKSFIVDLPCNRSEDKNIPKCCIFRTDQIISEFENLIMQNASKIH